MEYSFRINLTRAITLLIVLAVLVACVPLVNAQSLLTGDIAGTVTDPSGAVLVNATVSLKSLDRGETQSVTTNS